jgi:hypothetical protein
MADRYHGRIRSFEGGMVAESSGPESLAARRQLVAVLTVVVEPRGRIVYGDVVDPDTDDKTTFVGSSGIAGALETWVLRALRRSDQDRAGVPPGDRRTGPDE